jgi:hypothetical protein
VHSPYLYRQVRQEEGILHHSVLSQRSEIIDLYDDSWSNIPIENVGIQSASGNVEYLERQMAAVSSQGLALIRTEVSCIAERYLHRYRRCIAINSHVGMESIAFSEPDDLHVFLSHDKNFSEFCVRPRRLFKNVDNSSNWLLFVENSQLEGIEKAALPVIGRAARKYSEFYSCW